MTTHTHTRIVYKIKYHYLLMVFFLTFSSFGQVETSDINYTPDAIFDKVFDKDGNSYKLSEIVAGQPVAIRNGLTSTNTLLCTSGIFELYFESGCGMDVVGNSLNDQRRAIICQVFQDISDFINTPLKNSGNIAKIKFWIRNPANLSVPMPPSAAGLASAYYSLPIYSAANPNVNGIVDNEIWKTIHTGTNSYANTIFPILNTELVSGLYHGYACFNFAGTVNWNLDYNKYNPATGYVFNSSDLYTTILHEVTHALGFNSLIRFNGASQVNNSTSLFGNYYTRFDKYLKTSSNATLITNNTSTGGQMYGYNFTSSTSVLYPSCTLSPPIYNGNTGLFNCATSIKYNSSITTTIPVYNPPCFENGSSLSHFEDGCYNGNANDQYFVMSERASGLFAKRSLTSEERQVLCDIGYSVKGTYGNASNFTFKNYNTTDCSGVTVAGVNDGFLASGGYAFQGNSGTLITISGILNNDYTSGLTSNLNFEFVQDIYDPNAILSSTSGGFTGSSSSFTLNSAVPGVHLLRYVPYDNVTGQRGNITYIYVNVLNNCLNPNSCNLVKNGNFEEHITPTSSSQLYKACGWQNASYLQTADYFNSDATSSGVLVPCNDRGIQLDRLTGNNGYAGMYISPGRSFILQGVYSESIKTELSTSLIPNTQYQLKFDVSQADKFKQKSVKFQAFISDSNLNLTTGGIIPDANVNAPNQIFMTNATFSNVAAASPDGWQTITFNFTTSNNTNLKYLYLGGLNNVQFQTETNQNTNCSGSPIANYSAESYYYLDNVVLTQVSNPALLLPDTLCANQSITNLNTYLNSAPLGGTFSGPGVSGSTFTPTGVGVFTITYTTNTGCVVNLSDSIIVNAVSSVGILSGNQNVCKANTTTFSSTVTGGTWSSSNTAIATINASTGIITGVNPGTAIISYSITNSNGCVNSVTRNVTVLNPVKSMFLGLSETVMCQGSVPPTLTTLSDNGILGTWNPSVINNQVSGNYIFTPNAGQCARQLTVPVVVVPNNAFVANNDFFTPTYSASSVTTASVIDNDQYQGNFLNSVIFPIGVGYSIVPFGTTPFFSSGGISMNSSGVFTILPNTPSGTYTFQYVLQGTCVTTAPATVTIIVPNYLSQGPGRAVFEFCFNNNSATNSTQSTSTYNQFSLFDGTTVGGVPASGSNSQIVMVSPSSITGLPTSIQLNANGTFTIAAGTLPAGYNFVYKVCSLSGVYCSANINWSITIKSPIRPLSDTTTFTTLGVGSYNVLSNDLRYNCAANTTSPLSISSVVFTGSATTPYPYFTILSNGSIYANRFAGGGTTIPSGTYVLTYNVCDTFNPLVCQTLNVTIYVPVSTNIVNSNPNTSLNSINKNSKTFSKNGFQIIYFPDNNLKNKLLSATDSNNIAFNISNTNIVAVDTNNDGQIDTNEALQIGSLNLVMGNISDLTGLEYFENMKYISVDYNNITSCSLSLPSLQILNLNHNPLTSVSIAGLTALESLFMDYCNLTTLNTTNNNALFRLSVNNTPINNLNLGSNPNLSYLYCKNCPNLSSINIKNTSLLQYSSSFMIDNCWTGCSSLASICADANEISALQSYLSNCGVSTNNIDINSNCALGIDYNDSYSYTITPNPSNGVFTMIFPNNTMPTNGQIEVFNLLGQSVLTANLNKDKIQYELNLSDYPNGTYLVKTTIDSITKISKLIKN